MSDEEFDRRFAKVEKLRAAGLEPYPVRFERDRTVGELRAEFSDLGPGEETEVSVRVAGRLLLIRRQGKLTFGTLRDGTG
ncbi:MAG: lysine--tRNA ligase, partial [Acidimicrobiia bacterium]